jgi:DNA-directed RNA polymerase subunit RPC12/RpoP
MKKKCIICSKEKDIKHFPLNGKSPRCLECKKKFESKKKPGQEYFGI